jgi:hypothetical protein
MQAVFDASFFLSGGHDEFQQFCLYQFNGTIFDDKFRYNGNCGHVSSLFSWAFLP